MVVEITTIVKFTTIGMSMNRVPPRPQAKKTTITGSPIDASDVLTLVGLLLFGGGLWWLSPPVALIVVGGVVLTMGLVGAWLRGKREQPPPK